MDRPQQFRQHTPGMQVSRIWEVYCPAAGTPPAAGPTRMPGSRHVSPPWPDGYGDTPNYTADTRLSSFGAFTTGLTVAKTFVDGWSAYAKYQFYRQRPNWYAGGSGSPDILEFSARWIEIGISKSF